MANVRKFSRIAIKGAALIASLLLSSALVAFATPRTWQPVVLKGSMLRPLLGSSVAKLEVLALRGSELKPIPFQVDEALPDGTLALPSGPEPIVDESPGVLDGDDEIVFMISDLGECGVPPGKPPPTMLEVRLIDLLGGADRCAYIASVDRPERSTVDYVDYDPRKMRIESDHYSIRFVDEFPHYFALQNRKHENPLSLTDEFMVRVSARIFGYFKFAMTEHRDRARLLAYRDGPIRVIRRVAHWVPLVLGLHSPTVIVEEIYYRDYNEGPFQVHFPWVPRFVFGDINVMIGLDFVDAQDYSLLWSGMTIPPVRLGEVSMLRAIARETNPKQISWMAIRGHGRIVLQTFKPTPDLAKLRQELYLRPANSNHVENTAGTPSEIHTAIGANIKGWEELGRGWHKFNVVVIDAAENYPPDLIIDELTHEPVIKVRRLGSLVRQ